MWRFLWEIVVEVMTNTHGSTSFCREQFSPHAPLSCPQVPVGLPVRVKWESWPQPTAPLSLQLVLRAGSASDSTATTPHCPSVIQTLVLQLSTSTSTAAVPAFCPLSVVMECVFQSTGLEAQSGISVFGIESIRVLAKHIFTSVVTE